MRKKLTSFGLSLAVALVAVLGVVFVADNHAIAMSDTLIAAQAKGTDGGSGGSGNSGGSEATTGTDKNGNADTKTGSGSKCSGHHFMGLRAWYDNVEAVCSGKQPEDEYALRAMIWLIVLNLVTMVLQVAGYVCVGFVVWGGYQYMLSRGDAGKVASRKKTITNALVGIALCMTASLISGAIVDITSGAAANDATFVASLFNTAFLWAGIVCAIVIVMGGIAYVTSTGEPQKVSTAKNTIMNAAIGLIITLLAAAIVNLVVNAINNGA